jgi:TRAP-type mannitol/chloroaromatic compound transport system permease large subunit
MAKTRFIQSIIPAFVLALVSLALAFEVVSAGAETGAIGATAADVPPASAVESGRAFPWQQEVVR